MTEQIWGSLLAQTKRGSAADASGNCASAPGRHHAPFTTAIATTKLDCRRGLECKSRKMKGAR